MEVVANPQTAELERQAGRLTRALRAMIRTSPLDGLGPMEVARTLAVDKTLSSRLFTALRAHDSLAALSSLPGPAPLRRFVTAARAHGVTPRAAADAERRLREFEHALQRSFGTRTRLDAALSDALPDTRRRHLDTARQSVYRGMALLKGVSIDLTCNTWIVHPSRERSGRVDIQVVAAFVGMQRLRPTARVQLVASHVQARPQDSAALLSRFCRPSGVSVSVSRQGNETLYEVSALPVGRGAAADLVLAEFIPGAAPIGIGADSPLSYGDVVTHPYKRLALNILVHTDAWRGCAFTPRAYDAAGRGRLDNRRVDRDADRLPLDVVVTRHGTATQAALRAAPIPDYVEILKHVTRPRGWPLEEFELHSCTIDYPVYGSHIMLVLSKGR